ncbi:MAG: hypothetical protein KGJ07_01120 [Patescibacteria group bacterium]|nr:hypothetical protein [Patescibacteria group bacterium]
MKHKKHIQHLYSFGRLLRHFFLPHRSNNHRPKLLHSDSIFVVALIILASAFGLSAVKTHYPNVLGLSVNISSEDLLLQTNIQRQQHGLTVLQLNDQLSSAACAKRDNMFNYNYWAHVNPSTGQTPWVFIQASGYKYTYAGENLARGFTTAPDAMNAWMASPSHRENILSPNYSDVGFCVGQGALTGESDTVLIVQMFGGRALAVVPDQSTPLKPAVAEAAGNQNVIPTPTPEVAVLQKLNSEVTTSPVVDRFWFAKNMTQMLLVIFIIIFTLDLIIIERKQISRLVGHNLDHILFLTALLLFILYVSAGMIF